MIAGLLIVYSIVGLIGIPRHGPAMLFGWVFTGWTASFIWLLASVAELYLGIGLFRLKPRCRTLALFFFAFQFLEPLVSFARPDRESRITDYYHAVKTYYESRSRMPPSSNAVSAGLRFWLLEWGILTLFACWLLVKSAKAFDPDKS